MKMIDLINITPAGDKVDQVICDNVTGERKLYSKWLIWPWS